MIRTFAVAGAVLLMVAACGGDSDDPAQAPARSATPTATTAGADTGKPTDRPTVSAAPLPGTEPADNISLPDGFTAYAVAAGLTSPTSVSVAEDGTVYVAHNGGTIVRLVDEDGDGVYESAPTFYEAPASVTGILADAGGRVYVSSTGEVLLAFDANGDGSAEDVSVVFSDLPTGRHQNNGLAIGPDGRLYATVGSTCDDCDEENELSGTILQAKRDGSDMRVYATGLRNPYDITFDGAGRLWATDNGSDDPCATPDELNLIVDGGDYGWPYGADGCDNSSDGRPPAASLGLHTASTGITVDADQTLPDEYRGNLFMTIWGNFFDPVELSPRLMRATIAETPSGPTATVETFAEGFAHPIDVTTGGDGSLLVLDYGDGEGSGTLYRIVYTG